MGEHPLRIRSPAALPFFSPQPAEAAILPDGELRLADRPRKFLRCVPFPHLLPLDQHGEQLLHSHNCFIAFFVGHR